MALSEIESIGPHKQVKLLELFSTAKKVFSASQSELRSCGILSSEQITQIKKGFEEKLYQSKLKYLKEKDIHIVSYRDPDYPQTLLQIASYPILLFYRGNLRALHEPHRLAIVGSRNMTAYGKRVINEWVSEFIQKDIVIVSGMAFGVDVYCHQMSLESGGLTVAVQAQGVERGHPRAHQKIYERVIEKNGCVIGEFPYLESDMVDKFHFPRRNRLISGMCDAVLIVEAAEKSGALITARYALDQNREVYAVPGGVHQKMSRGCLKLIQQGAKVVTCPQDILEDFGLAKKVADKQEELPLKEHRIATDHFETPLERQIFTICRQQPLTMDVIIDNVSESAPSVSATITKMQLMGRLKETDGRRFVAVE